MRAKVFGILICGLQLTLMGCQQKSEDASQSTTTQNVSRAAVPQQSTESANTIAQPTPAIAAASSPTVAASPAIVTGEEQSSASNAASPLAKPDPCALIRSAEIQSVQGDAVKETKASDQTSESFIVSQCFYGTSTFSNSINLEITRSNQSRNNRRVMREFWNRKFHENSNEEREREREEEPAQEALKPKLIKGVGDEAFWVKSAVGGALYVLKNDAFFRISIGGKGSDQMKIMRARALALKAVNRL
jgi:hypothetical protein